MMRFNTDKINWTDAMKAFAKEQAERKLARIVDDLFEVDFRVSKVNKEVKVCVSVDGYRAQAINEDFYIAVVDALSKIKQIIIKNVKKINSKDNRYSVVETQTDELNVIVPKEKMFFMEPEPIDVALSKIEKTDYNFYIFKDIDNENTISVLYKRFDGTYGVIRCK